MSSYSTQSLTPETFNIVRLARLAGVLLLGGVIFFMDRNDMMPDVLDAETATLLRYAFYAVATGAAVGIVLVRQKATAALTFREYVPRAILGLALAEGTALFGAVYWMLTGFVLPYLLGLVLFAIALFAFPKTQIQG